MSNTDSNEQLITRLEKLDTTPIPTIPNIKSEYISATGKQADLVNRQLEDAVSIQTGKIHIKFPEPIWVYDLTLWLAEKSQPKSDKLLRHTTAKFTFARGGKSEIAMAAYDSYIDCYPKDFITEIEIKFFGINKISLLTPPACRKISIKGLTADEFEDFCDKSGSFAMNSKKLNDGKAQLISELRQTNARIVEANESLTDVNADLDAAKEIQRIETERLNSTQLKVSSAEAKLSILNTQSSELDQRISENNRNILNLANSIQDHRQELDALLADRNVFMEEFKSYVEQGQGNIKAYLIIGVALFSIMTACLWRLIESALKLSEDPQLLTTISAFDLFLSRLPLAFVLGTVIIICMRLISSLLTKTFEIHQERLLLSKLSILAKDNSFSSAEGLNVEPNLIYDKRVSLKMELLKEFLSGNYKGATEKEKALRESFRDFKEGLKDKGKSAANDPTKPEEAENSEDAEKA